MGTHWNVTFRQDGKGQEKAVGEIMEMASRFNALYSRFVPTSLVSKLHGSSGKIRVPEDLWEMLTLYKKIYPLSGKLFNPLIGKLISDLGYDPDYGFQPVKNPKGVPDLDENIKFLGDRWIMVTRGLHIDLGALGKGYFLDRIVSYLKNEGFDDFIVDGGGDIFYQGEGIIRAGLEDPSDPGKVIGVLEMKKGSLCASSGNRRKWKGYHHIINPESKTSPGYIMASWVYSGSAAISDALATALFLAPPENFASSFSFEYCLLNHDYMIRKSAGFEKSRFFSG